MNKTIKKKQMVNATESSIPMNRALIVSPTTQKKNEKQLVKSRNHSSAGNGSKRVPSHAAQTQKLLASNSKRKKLTLDIPSLVGAGRSRTKSFTPDEVMNALIMTRGLVSYAAKHLGVGYRKLRTYLDENEKMKQIINDVQEITTDYVESKLFNLIDREQEKSVHFYMRARGKSRGYSVQHEDDMEKFPNINFIFREVTREDVERKREQKRLMKDANPT